MQIWHRGFVCYQILASMRLLFYSILNQKLHGVYVTEILIYYYDWSLIIVSVSGTFVVDVKHRIFCQ